MKQEISNYEVRDHKGRWMGSYSCCLHRNDKVTALDMAIINAKHHAGEVLAVYRSGLREVVCSYGSGLKDRAIIPQ